jgi:parvulin-like peptidyl-prolyl isomerase
MAIIQGINLNAQNSQLMVNNVVDELIREKVKLSKINEYQIKVKDEEYAEFEINFFTRNKFNQDEILNLLKENNINYQELKSYLMGELAWNKLVNGLFFRLTSISDLEVDELISKNPSLSVEQAENLVIQRQLDLQSSKLLRDIMNEATIEYK